LCEDKGYIKKSTGRLKATDDKSKGAVVELEKELVYTKQQLNSTIEQMETSLEELKSTNEELQSTNEELQSTNEESLTTKEEMQSLNEELMTINMQYQSKAEELTRINNDMKNLLDSTEIGTIFLDNNLDILRYTPQVRKLFNLIPTDIGRPITHVVSNFDNSQIEQEIKKVIDTLANTEIEVKTRTNEWYRVRIMPYRTLDNFISGAVLTFTLITGFKHMETLLKDSGHNLNTLLQLMDNPAVCVDEDYAVLSVNEGFTKQFHIKEEDIKSKQLIAYLSQFVKTDTLVKMLDKVKAGSEIERADFTFTGTVAGNCEISTILFKGYPANGSLLITFSFKAKSD